MKVLKKLLCGVSVGMAVCSAQAQDMLVSSYGGGASFVKDGKMEWTFGYQKGVCQDSWVLADDTILVPIGDTVQIVNKDKEVLWKYQGVTPPHFSRKPKNAPKHWHPRKLEIHTCQPLPDGSVMIVEGQYARVIEVDKTGKIVKEVKFEGERGHNHNFTRIVRKTKQGTYVATLNRDRVGEFDGNGKKLRMIDKTTTPDITWKHVHGLTVLENGNWLIGTGFGATFFEIDKDNNVVWSVKPEDVPEIGLKYAAGMQRLKDGTTVFASFISNYQVFAVNKEKKVLWKWQGPKNPKHARGITNVQMINEKGNPALFELQK